MNKFWSGLSFGWLAAVGIASAHHSAAAFDRSKPYTMIGTVKRFNWANPHAWIYVDVPDAMGDVSTLRPGDKIKVVVAPYRDGTKRGEFMAIFKDGKQLKF
jgi:hypothetical protein